MAQRWMQAKILLGKKNGTMRSGCNRATGACWDDLIATRGKYDGADRGFHPVTDHTPNVQRLAKRERPVAWGKGRKARRTRTMPAKPWNII